MPAITKVHPDPRGGMVTTTGAAATTAATMTGRVYKGFVFGVLLAGIGLVVAAIILSSEQGCPYPQSTFNETHCLPSMTPKMIVKDYTNLAVFFFMFGGVSIGLVVVLAVLSLFGCVTCV